MIYRVETRGPSVDLLADYLEDQGWGIISTSQINFFSGEIIARFAGDPLDFLGTGINTGDYIKLISPYGEAIDDS